MRIAVLYVGSSLLAPLRRAERDINARYRLGLRIAAHNCTLPLGEDEWASAERDIAAAGVVFVLHVTDGENAARIGAALDRYRERHHAVVVINCLGELMRRTRMGKLNPGDAFGAQPRTQVSRAALRLLRKLGSWMSHSAAARHPRRRPEKYLTWAQRASSLMRFVPVTGKLRDARHYLALFAYFLQPTPANIASMILYALRHYVPDCPKDVEAGIPERRPVLGIYHPDAKAVFESVDDYRKWYRLPLDPNQAVGLLLMRPQVVSGGCRHYDSLIRALEAERLPVLPVLSTLMDNREACDAFFVDPATGSARVAQIISLTGFSFVGGPAMNDSQAAAGYLRKLNRPLRLAVSLEAQRIEDWEDSRIGLNPVQTAMQVAIPEIDGATEPFILGGTRQRGEEPEAIEERCRRIARRLKRWSRLRSTPPADVRLGFLIYCFPPNRGNLGTAADLDVFPSLWEMLGRLQLEGYRVERPESPEALRALLVGGSGLASVAYRLSAGEYYRLCPYVEEIESEWGPAPGRINVQGGDILIHGIELGNVFVGVQPTFGYEGDPMRMMMAEGGAPHHGFMGLYTYLDHVFHADALIHVGTHGALEFMPGKQAGLSGNCWPDRLIGEFPNIYVYSVNNPSEGTIAKRRSYAVLVSYLTPPIDNAGLYKELASLKELIDSYRATADQQRREQLFPAIQEMAASLKMTCGSEGP